MAKPHNKLLDISFELGVALKGINAVVEIALGLVALLVTRSTIVAVAGFLTKGELVEDPDDRLARFVLASAHHISHNGRLFLAIYLLSHGIIKIILVIGLLKDKAWAYPISLIGFGLFILFQVAEYVHTHSLWLIWLSLFDALIMWLIWKEYQTRKRGRDIVTV